MSFCHFIHFLCFFNSFRWRHDMDAELSFSLFYSLLLNFALSLLNGVIYNSNRDVRPWNDHYQQRPILEIRMRRARPLDNVRLPFPHILPKVRQLNIKICKTRHVEKKLKFLALF